MNHWATVTTINYFIGVPERMKTMQITKNALNLATNEIRNDSKSFYAYIRSKQKVRD